jgi:3-methylcrotonyl-CoA carboxylase beta subunit
LAGHELYGKDDVKSGGMVTGIGLVNNRLCMLIANDPSVKGYYISNAAAHIIPSQSESICGLNRSLCRTVYHVSIWLTRAAHFCQCRLTYSQRRIISAGFFITSLGIPQISLVLGSCTAGGAYVPAMSDENIIVKGNGTIFLGGPPLVKAATGEIVTSEDLGGAIVHGRHSGVSDYIAENEE